MRKIRRRFDIGDFHERISRRFDEDDFSVLFDSFFDALYWATISITTIGYGDIYPTTDIGRFITMISALMGVAVIALPSGMITAAYMNEISKKKSKYEL